MRDHVPINKDYLKTLIQIVPYTHVYYCPKGMHFGVIAYESPVCPMGCNT